MQSNTTHWLAYIDIIGNLHDVDLKAFSDIADSPDTVVNSSAVVGLDKFIPSFAVSDVSLF